MNPLKDEPGLLKKTSVLALGFTLLVILWGAYVRKTHSGAGCGDHWPLCNGQYIPFDPTVETLIEYSHRLTSGIAFLLVLVVFVLSQLQLQPSHPTRRPALLSLIFMIVEALLGAGLVIFGLVESNDSTIRACAVALHLANTFVLLGFMTQTVLTLYDNPTEFEPPLGWKQPNGALLRNPLNVTFALILVLTASFGAIAALGNTLFPAANVFEGMASRLNTNAHFLERLKIYHPILAIVGGLSLVALIQYRASKQEASVSARSGGVLSGLIISNILLGAFDVVLLAPTWLSMLHLFFADLIWISYVWYLYEQPVHLKIKIATSSKAPQQLKVQ